MKIVFIAHPIGGDVEGNLYKVREIVHHLNTTTKDIVPFVPYYSDLMALDDAKPDERARGILNDKEFFERRLFDELWVYGNKMSNGVLNEIRLAIQYEIPVVFKSAEMKTLMNLVYLKELSEVRRAFPFPGSIVDYQKGEKPDA